MIRILSCHYEQAVHVAHIKKLTFQLEVGPGLEPIWERYGSEPRKVLGNRVEAQSAFPTTMIPVRGDGLNFIARYPPRMPCWPYSSTETTPFYHHSPPSPCIVSYCQVGSLNAPPQLSLSDPNQMLRNVMKRGPTRITRQRGEQGTLTWEARSEAIWLA